MSKTDYWYSDEASFSTHLAVNKIPDSIKVIIEKLSDTACRLSETDCIPDSDRPWENFRQEVVEDLQWFYNETINYVGVVTSARELYLQNQTEELIKFQNVLSIFSVMVQLEQL